jgi:hypothetical protein
MVIYLTLALQGRLPRVAHWARMRGRMGEADTIRGVWRAAAGIMVSYPLATLAPAMALGAIGEVPAYLIDRRLVLDQALTTVTAYLAYYLYLAYAEGIMDKARARAPSLGLRGMLAELVGAAPYVPSVLVAALIALSVTTLATGLLLIPGMWLYTRWSLATPVIRDRGLGPIAATRRSNQLAKGRFWFVFMTATVAYYVEGVLTHAGAEATGALTGSYTWGEWAGGSVLATLLMPLAAFATSLVHATLAERG